MKKNYESFDVAIVFKGIYLDSDTLVTCKNFSKKIIWINVFPDDPFNAQFIKDSNYNLINTIKYYDFFCIWSHEIFKKLRNIIKYNKLIYLPFGYDPFIHFSSGNNSEHKNLVTFFGTLDFDRAKFLSKVKNINIRVYGNNSYKYKKLLKNNNVKFYPEIQGAKMRNIMSKSLVSINILRKQNKNSHNMKTFEIPAMNCLMLTTRSSEQNILLPENKACFMYSTVNEFNKKLNYIKNNPNKAAKIRSSGYKLIKKHTYLHRASQLLNEIKNPSN
jgi:spore maturation protein CgeB